MESVLFVTLVTVPSILSAFSPRTSHIQSISCVNSAQITTGSLPSSSSSSSREHILLSPTWPMVFSTESSRTRPPVICRIFIDFELAVAFIVMSLLSWANSDSLTPR